MALSTSTMTMSFSMGTVYTDTYSADVTYTLHVGTETSYSLTQYVKIPSTTTVETYVINGVSSMVTATVFITGTELTTYLNSVAPVTELIKTARAADQAEYLATYTGTGTVFVPPSI